MKWEPITRLPNFLSATLITLGAAAASGLSQSGLEGMLVSGAITGALGFLTNRFASQIDAQRASAPATHEDTGPNHHLTRLAGATLRTLLEHAEVSFSDDDGDPALGQRGNDALRFAAERAEARWLLLVEQPDADAFLSLDGQRLADAIAAHVTAPDLARVLTRDAWDCFAAFLFGERGAVCPPPGLVEILGEYFHCAFASEFYEQAKQAATREPVTYAALQLHFLGALRVENQQQSALLLEIRELLTTSAQTRISGFDPDQARSLANAIRQLGSDLAAVQADVDRLPRRVAVIVADELRPQLQRIEDSTHDTLLGVEKIHRLLEEFTITLVSDRQLSIGPAPAPPPEPTFEQACETIAAQIPEHHLTGIQVGTLFRAFLRTLHARGWDRIEIAWAQFCICQYHEALAESDAILHEQATSEKPNLAVQLEAHLIRAESFTQLDRLEDATQALRGSCDAASEALQAARSALDAFPDDDEKAVEKERALEAWCNAHWKLAETIESIPHFPEAIAAYRQAMQGMEELLGDTHPDLRELLLCFGKCLQEAGDYPEAEATFRRMIRLDGEARPPRIVELAADFESLGILLARVGRYDEALSLCRKSLAILATVQDLDDDRLASSCNNLADLFATLGQYDEAEGLHRRSIYLREKALPEGEIELANNYSNLAHLLTLKALFTEAEQLHRKSLKIREEALPPDDLGIARSCNNFAVLLEKCGRHAEAEPLHRRGLAIRERALPPGHPEIARSCNNLAVLLFNTGNTAEAEPLHRRALEIRERALTPSHPDIAVSCNNLACLLEKSDRATEAEALHRRALAIREQALPPGHPDIAVSCNNLAVLLENTGKNAEAEPLYRRGLAIREQALPPGHPDIASSLSNLANFLEKSDRVKEAEPLRRRALAILEQSAVR